MIEFAVKIGGEEEGRWVLAVDPVGEKFLILDDNRAFRWVPMGACTFLKAQTPDVPRAVLAVQPQAAAPKLTMPSLRLNGGL